MPAPLTTYTVKAIRDEPFWFLHVVELNEYTQAHDIAEIEAMARDLIQLVTGVADAHIALDIDLQLPQTSSEEAGRDETA